MAFHLLDATIDSVHTAMRAGEITCRQLVELYLARIDAYDHKGPVLNSVENVNPSALKEADRLDAAFRASGLSGPLHGIPVLLKDQADVGGRASRHTPGDPTGRRSPAPTAAGPRGRGA